MYVCVDHFLPFHLNRLNRSTHEPGHRRFHNSPFAYPSPTSWMDISDDVLASFVAVTGADEQTARHFLSAAAGDVDAAVSLFLDGTGPKATAANEEDDEEVRAPIQPRRAVLVDGDEAYSPSHYPSFSLTEPFRDFRTEASPFTDSATERGRRLAELFRPPTEIMFVGTFEQARRRDGCW